ncbi:MAG: hypothetical protein JST00_47735 [Deltaproteobacteria bacterium]|nr:hypothetical protein [Deltaproteobacteria bacterium]
MSDTPAHDDGDAPEDGALGLVVAPPARRRNVVLVKLSGLGASAQAAIPGLYAWAITVMPAAFSKGAPMPAKVAAIVGVIALTTAPFVEGAGLRAPPPAAPEGAAPEPPVDGRRAPRSPGLAIARWTGPTWARIWSVWGFVLSSAIVWAVVPGALSSPRFDGVRGTLGVIGWGLFAFASAGPTLRSDPEAAKRVVAGSPLKPRSELPGGDGAYLTAGVLVALAMQAVGWGVVAAERAVLVRLVTLVCGVAVLGATTSIALARHATRTPAAAPLRMRRALPWVVILALFLGTGAVWMLR